MANTYTLIASNTTTSAVASVSFSSIPATFTDLLIKASARNTDTGGGSASIRFNGDNTTGNYSVLRLLAAGSGTPGSAIYTGSAGAMFISSNDYTANTFGNTEIYIPNYNLSTTYKAVYSDSTSENNAAESYINISSGLYKSNSAVTSIEILAGGAFNFVTGSTFYLYGIKNS
jgi:hypothetical protein